MVVRYIGVLGALRSRCAKLLLLVLASCLSAGCADEPRPRSYMEFMEDSLAREGTLARCNRDRDATASDAECMNARRAASTVAARADEALRDQRDAESELLRAAARDRADAAQQTRQQVQAVAEAQAEAEYEAQWSEPVEIVLADGSLAAPVSDRQTYSSLGSTLGAVAPEPEPGYGAASSPSLDFLELPPSATPVMPYVEIPASVRRLELAPEPQLEEISIPATATYRE